MTFFSRVLPCYLLLWTSCYSSSHLPFDSSLILALFLSQTLAFPPAIFLTLVFSLSKFPYLILRHSLWRFFYLPGISLSFSPSSISSPLFLFFLLNFPCASLSFSLSFPFTNSHFLSLNLALFLDIFYTSISLFLSLSLSLSLLISFLISCSLILSLLLLRIFSPLCNLRLRTLHRLALIYPFKHFLYLSNPPSHVRARSLSIPIIHHFHDYVYI